MRRSRPIKLLFLALVVIGAAAAGVVAFGSKSPPAPDQPASPVEPGPPPQFDPPGLSASEYLNTGPDATYVGWAACKGCHSGEHRTWDHTTHRHALADLDPAAEPPDGSFFHPASGRTYTIGRGGGGMWHREELKDERGRAVVTAEHPVRYLIGSGHHTRSYLIETDGFLAESPVTWYTARKRWDVSPGYDKPTHWGFERAAETSCLYCHVGRIEAIEKSYQRLKVTEMAIGCERCHGPGSLHAAERKANAPARKTIVNPAKLPRDRQEAICAQCHLSLDGTVTVRGRRWEQFRPGLPLSDFVLNYRLDEPRAGMKVVGHGDQMHQSKCYQRSDALTCSTCHASHAAPAEPADRRAGYNRTCQSCHPGEACKLERPERLKRNPGNDCVTCHMPPTETDIPHLAFTHHRIGVHDARPSAAPAPAPTRAADLIPLEDVARFAPVDRDRNLGLAYFGLSQRQKANPQIQREYEGRARRLLAGVRARGLRDGEVAAALMVLVRPDDPELAVRLAREALASADLPPKTRVNCLYTVADVGLETDQIEAAGRALDELVETRRLAPDWTLVGRLRQRTGSRDALAAFEKAVQIAPFRPQIRRQLADAYRQAGDTAAARREQQITDQLQMKKEK